MPRKALNQRVVCSPHQLGVTHHNTGVLGLWGFVIYCRTHKSDFYDQVADQVKLRFLCLSCTSFIPLQFQMESVAFRLTIMWSSCSCQIHSHKEFNNKSKFLWSVQWPIIPLKKIIIPIFIDILSKHISLYALGRLKWILDIIWPFNLLSTF